MRTRRQCLLFIVGLVAFVAMPLWSQGTLAFVGLDNASQDPRYDYLAPIIEGILLFDLGQGHVDLADRKNLGRILAEQEFQQSGGLTDPATAARAGKIANARWLLFGNYAVLDGEVILNLSLADVEDGMVLPFRERGKGEHVVHYGAEKIIRHITRRPVILADASNNRSLVSLRDEEPGTLYLHSAIQGARILIDGEFAGFTKGEEQQALVFDRLPPGRHQIRTELSRQFGVLSGTPLTFGPWDIEFEIRPGRSTILLDGTRHFTDAYRNVATVMYNSRSVTVSRPELFHAKDEKTFVNQAGEEVAVSLILGPPAKDGKKIPLRVDYRIGSGKVKTLDAGQAMPREGDERQKADYALPGLKLHVETYISFNSLECRWELLRTDLDEEALRP